jgi:DNA-binding PadR family transcriptional regulator
MPPLLKNAIGPGHCRPLPDYPSGDNVIYLDIYYVSYYSNYTMRKRYPSTALSLAILGLISQEPLSGYGLRKIFLTTPMGHFSPSPGAIYPALKKMEHAGLITGRIEGENTLRPKRTYTITAKGLKALRQRLSEPISDSDITWRLDELVLRFAFMGDVLGERESIVFLCDLASRIDTHVEYLKDHLKIQREREHNRLTGAYALEQGIAKYEATATWARRVIADLKSE